MNAQNVNTKNEFCIKSVKPRYININEDIFLILTPESLKIYIALRFESDYSKNTSSVKKNIQFIVNKTKLSRRKIIYCFKELESLGLLYIEKNNGYQSIYWLASDLHYFTNRPVHDVHGLAEFEQFTERGVHNMHGGVHNMHDIYTNSITNKESNTFSITKESEIEEVVQKAKKCLEKTKENLPSTSSDIVPYKYQETNLLEKNNTKPLTVLQETNTLGLSDEYLDELIKIRKANGGKVTPKALKAVYQELIKLKNAGLDLNECLSMYANCGWKGFVADWFIKTIKGKKNQYDFYTSDDTSWGDEMKNDPFFQGLLG